MSNVTVEIAGRRYTIACAQGEEAHIEMLGRTISTKLAAVPSITAQSEPRTLLFAALLLADELHEAQKPQTADSGAKMAEPLENMAEKLETLATRLEQGQTSA
ncbi:hypothetical protein GCM10009127_18460 [Alteraurantiacibacter aestuarii]|uniref:cell division protein ZapA n=1 Tax=Alteraurantiacibacter aestuarii TaxID=650004 RepID=UPI0031D17147